MTMVIKAGVAEAAVRPLAMRRASRPVAEAAVVADARIGELEEENARLREALEKALDAAADAAAKARESERKEAVEAARGEAAKRLEALDQGLAAALAAWQEALAGLDRLAPLIARTALSKLFEPSEDQAELVGRAIARQMAGLRRETALRLRVSAADFADDAALGALRERAGAGRLDIVCDPDLASGECRLDLALGHVELTPAAQWRELAALLESLAFGEACR